MSALSETLLILAVCGLLDMLRRYAMWHYGVVQETWDLVGPPDPVFIWLHKQLRPGVKVEHETVHARPGTVRRYRRNRRAA